tara:strand:- start:785 stop:1213 length:429 start_codon:yes stop_codon:yes gene_type:complete
MAQETKGDDEDDDMSNWKCFGLQWADDETCKDCAYSTKCCLEYAKTLGPGADATPFEVVPEDAAGCFGEDYDGAGVCRTCSMKMRCAQEMVKMGRVKAIGAQTGDPAVVGNLVVGTIKGFNIETGDALVDFLDCDELPRRQL